MTDQVYSEVVAREIRQLEKTIDPRFLKELDASLKLYAGALINDGPNSLDMFQRDLSSRLSQLPNLDNSSSSALNAIAEYKILREVEIFARQGELTRFYGMNLPFNKAAVIGSSFPSSTRVLSREANKMIVSTVLFNRYRFIEAEGQMLRAEILEMPQIKNEKEIAVPLDFREIAADSVLRRDLSLVLLTSNTPVPITEKQKIVAVAYAPKLVQEYLKETGRIK